MRFRVIKHKDVYRIQHKHWSLFWRTHKVYNYYRGELCAQEYSTLEAALVDIEELKEANSGGKWVTVWRG